MEQIDGFLRLPQVIQLTTMSRSEIYQRIKEGRFPKQIRLSHKRAVWRVSEVRAWIEAQRVRRDT